MMSLQFKRKHTEMAKLTVIGQVRAKRDQLELVKAELEKLVPTTRQENGCIQYDLHQDNQHPTHFLFYENWESRELWQQHMNNQHIQDYLAATDGAVEDFTVYEMTHIA